MPGDRQNPTDDSGTCVGYIHNMFYMLEHYEGHTFEREKLSNDFASSKLKWNDSILISLSFKKPVSARHGSDICGGGISPLSKPESSSSDSDRRFSEFPTQREFEAADKKRKLGKSRRNSLLKKALRLPTRHLLSPRQLG